jgi:hypothetical protein
MTGCLPPILCSFGLDSSPVEQVFLWMQTEVSVFVRETDSGDETRELIRMFTKSIAMAPYKLSSAQARFNFFTKSARAPQKVALSIDFWYPLILQRLRKMVEG